MPSTNLIDSSTRPFNCSTERYLALVESGIILERRGIELIDSQIIETEHQGELHWFMFAALQRAFAALGSFDKGLVVQPTVVLGEGNVFDPEFAFIRPKKVSSLGLPSGQDVLHIIEVSVSSLNQDLGPKKDAYAASNIPHYWVVDGIKRGVWAFANPTAGIYAYEQFFAADTEIDVPALGQSLRLDSIFPKAS